MIYKLEGAGSELDTNLIMKYGLNFETTEVVSCSLEGANGAFFNIIVFSSVVNWVKSKSSSPVIVSKTYEPSSVIGVV